MKLNPSKCMFGVTVGKFLGFIVTQRGIKVNLDKIRAIIEMAPPRNVKEVKSKQMPTFLLHTKEAFKDLKAYLSSPPLLSPSKPGEELFLYLAISLATVSAALVREEDKAQKPTN